MEGTAGRSPLRKVESSRGSNGLLLYSLQNITALLSNLDSWCKMEKDQLLREIKSDIDKQGWENLICLVSLQIQKCRGLLLEVDPAIVRDVIACAVDSLAGYVLKEPNAAKIAGHMCYWICRLRPVRNLPGRKFYRLINEDVALQACLGVCDNYIARKQGRTISVDHPILLDWVTSLRSDIDSPNALAISFELLSGKRLPTCGPGVPASTLAT